MKALSLHNPWALLMASGAKTVETRSWGTSYRGPLAIHASKAFDSHEQTLFVRHPEFLRFVRERGLS